MVRIVKSEGVHHRKRILNDIHEGLLRKEIVFIQISK